jgi:hypothetical protein
VRAFDQSGRRVQDGVLQAPDPASRVAAARVTPLLDPLPDQAVGRTLLLSDVVST